MAKVNPKMTTQAPEGLSTAALYWWNALHRDYQIDDAAGRLLLETAARSFDRLTGARKAIDKQGALIIDRRGKPHLNPLMRVERDARNSLIQCLRQLKLDI